MTFEEWKNQLTLLDQGVSDARMRYESLKNQRADFLKESLGFSEGDFATLLGTAEMISKIMDMKMGDKGRND